MYYINSEGISAIFFFFFEKKHKLLSLGQNNKPNTNNIRGFYRINIACRVFLFLNLREITSLGIDPDTIMSRKWGNHTSASRHNVQGSQPTGTLSSPFYNALPIIVLGRSEPSVHT